MAYLSQPVPLFDTRAAFMKLNFSNMECELPVVRQSLASFDPAGDAETGYLQVRTFLRSYSGGEATFNAYRTHIERLLLWALIYPRKPLLTLTRTDAEAFLEFCLKPDSSWVGPPVKARFQRVGGRRKSESDSHVTNPDWRPFSLRPGKAEASIAAESGREPKVPAVYTMTSGTIGQVLSVCTSFFQFCIDEGLTEANPFRAIKQKSRFKQHVTRTVQARSLTALQWSFVIETAEKMADEDPSLHERTLFIVATLFSMYLRVSDLVGRDNWMPTMGAFQKVGDDWFMEVVGKGNKRARISVRDEYLDYLKRYRAFLGLTPLPYPGEATPLLHSLHGRPGLSDRHIRHLLQEVFDTACVRMRSDGFPEHEITALRAASLHWLRHTAATMDAPFRDPKDLQADLRHESMTTTMDNYYDSLDANRSASVRRLGIRDR